MTAGSGGTPEHRTSTDPGPLGLGITPLEALAGPLSAQLAGRARDELWPFRADVDGDPPVIEVDCGELALVRQPGEQPLGLVALGGCTEADDRDDAVTRLTALQRGSMSNVEVVGVFQEHTPGLAAARVVLELPALDQERQQVG